MLTLFSMQDSAQNNQQPTASPVTPAPVTPPPATSSFPAENTPVTGFSSGAPTPTPVPATPAPEVPATDPLAGGAGLPVEPEIKNDSSFQAPGPSSAMKAIGLVVLAIVVIGGFGFGGYYLGSKNVILPISNGTPTPTETLSALATPEPTPTPDPMASWKTFTSTTLGFSMRYPSDVVVKEDKEVSFTKSGPSQKDATEFSDGIFLSVSTGSLKGVTLTKFIDNSIIALKSGTKLSGAVADVTAGTLVGKKFTVEGGLGGPFTFYYFPKGDKDYFLVSDSTKDPSSSGFAKTVSTMVTTFASSSASASASPTATPKATATP